MDLVHLFLLGGIAMWPILFGSIAAVTVFFERLWSLRRSKWMADGFVDAFRGLVARGRPGEAAELCNARAALPLARIARAGLAHQAQGADMIRFMMSETGAREAAELERYVAVLGTVAYISPLLGLFGTVSGMIKAFNVISTHTAVNPQLLAAGISEALITTYAGLAVAIPTVVMHWYVQSRVDRISRELEKESLAIAEALIGDSSDSASLKLLTPSRR